MLFFLCKQIFTCRGHCVGSVLVRHRSRTGKMIIKVLDYITKSLFGRMGPPTLSLLPPLLVPTTSGNFRSSLFSLKDLLDGILFATPKRRHNIWKLLRNRYGNDNWKYGQKLWKPKRTVVTCTECGSFHEFNTICRVCYTKVEEESKKIIKSIRDAWGRGIIDKEVQVVYEGETSPETGKRIVELEKRRPLWFVSNLSQKAANPALKRLDGSAIEHENRTVEFKEENK